MSARGAGGDSLTPCAPVCQWLLTLATALLIRQDHCHQPVVIKVVLHHMYVHSMYMYISESVDSMSRDGTDTPIYVIH